MLTLIVIPLILGAFGSGLVISLFSLYLGWRMGPRLSKNNLICFSAAALGVFFWITLLLPFTTTSVSANNLDELPAFLISVVLVGATPLAAFPAILFYGGSGNKARRPAIDKNIP